MKCRAIFLFVISNSLAFLCLSMILIVLTDRTLKIIALEVDSVAVMRVEGCLIDIIYLIWLVVDVVKKSNKFSMSE